MTEDAVVPSVLSSLYYYYFSLRRLATLHRRSKSPNSAGIDDGVAKKKF